MAWYTTLLRTSVDRVVEATGAALNNLFTSDDEREKNKIAMMQITLAADQSRRELEAKLDEAYLADASDLRKLITVEIQSQDPYIRRSRPTFNYIFYMVILFNYVVIPILAQITGAPRFQPIELPADLWYVFGIGFVGYGYLRTVEKTGNKIPKLSRE